MNLVPALLAFLVGQTPPVFRTDVEAVWEVMRREAEA